MVVTRIPRYTICGTRGTAGESSGITSLRGLGLGFREECYNGSYHVSPVKRNAHTRIIIGHDRRLVILYTHIGILMRINMHTNTHIHEHTYIRIRCVVRPRSGGEEESGPRHDTSSLALRPDSLVCRPICSIPHRIYFSVLFRLHLTLSIYLNTGICIFYTYII